MRTSVFLLIPILLLESCYFKSVESDQPKEFESNGIISLNQDWQFKIDNATNWTSTDLPHVPRIEPLVVNDQWQGKLVYTKSLDLPEVLAGKTILHFEGVMHQTSLFVNDIKIKEHVGGYLPFSVDISDHIRSGKNQISLEVLNTDNSIIPPGKPLSGLDFNYYGGIYRDVWLIRKNDIHITDPFLENHKDSGWLIHFSDVMNSKAKGTLILHLRNDSKVSEDLTIQVELAKNEHLHNFQRQITLKASKDSLITLDIEIDNPLLWSTTSPTLYNLSVQVISSKGIELDKIDEKIGIRKIELTNDGFFLNEQKLFMRGTNRHQEYPYVGYAISNNANYRDALKIKNAGFDFVRLSHYPQDESFLDACDELGILVMNAIPGWQYFGGREFVDNSFQDIRDMARRDRNHPSVIFWEVSLNESGMTDEYMKKANKILREELPFDDTYTAGWIDHSAYDLYIPARQHAKAPHYWTKYKKGERNVFISEYGDWEYYAHNAGFNQTTFEGLTEHERNSRQLRANGEKRLLQQALNFQEATNSNRKGTRTIGHANWLMFDYNRGYADDLEASGISDIFRIPKFAYYFYQSQRSADEKIIHDLVQQGSMLKIASYWTKESSTNVRVFSNCEEVELYLNDSLISRQKPLVNGLSDQLIHPPFEFKIDHFEYGQLSANGFIGNRLEAVDSVSTPGEAIGIRLNIDVAGVDFPEKNDLIFLYAEIIDSQDNLVINSFDEIKFELTGPGKLIGTNPVNAEAGVATILFQGDPSSVSIVAQSNNLKSATFQ